MKNFFGKCWKLEIFMTLHALWLGLAEEPQMKHEINKTCCDQTGSHWGPQAGFFQINPCQLLSKTITFRYFYYQTKLRRPIFGYIYIYALLWSRPKLYDYIYIPIAAKWFKVGIKSCSSFSFCFVHKYNLMKSEEKDTEA